VVITHRVNKSNFRAVFNSFFAKASDLIDAGYPELELKACTPSKTYIQRQKYHAMIGDIARQVEFDGKRYDSEVWKAKLIDQFEHEIKQSGDSLRHPSRMVLSMDGQRVVTVRPSSEGFTKSEANLFIEYLYQQGADLGVVWSEKVEEYLGNYL